MSRPLRRCELSRPDNRVQRRVCDRWTHSDAERTCWPVGPTQSTPPDTKRTALVVSCRVLRAVWIGHYTRCFFLYRKRRPKRPQNLVISFILCAWFFINFLNFVTSCRLVTEWKRRTDLWTYSKDTGKQARKHNLMRIAELIQSHALLLWFRLLNVFLQTSMMYEVSKYLSKYVTSV